MRKKSMIVGAVSLLAAGCARLVPPDAIVALDAGPQEFQVVIGTSQRLKLVGTRGDGRTVTVAPREVRLTSHDPSVARVTADGAVHGVRLGRTSISATLDTPSGPVTVDGIRVAVAALIAAQ